MWGRAEREPERAHLEREARAGGPECLAQGAAVIGVAAHQHGEHDVEAVHKVRHAADALGRRAVEGQPLQHLGRGLGVLVLAAEEGDADHAILPRHHLGLHDGQANHERVLQVRITLEVLFQHRGARVEETDDAVFFSATIVPRPALALAFALALVLILLLRLVVVLLATPFGHVLFTTRLLELTVKPTLEN